MVNGYDLIFEHFERLTDLQKNQFKLLGPFYKEWNAKVNMISRKDIDSLYSHHVLHSLSVAKFISFKDGSRVLDLGTGGGLPGIPLAILFPEVQFLLVDGKAKKISVVNQLIEELKLRNVMALHKRGEELKIEFDFVLARAVTRLDKLLEFCLPLISDSHMNNIPNGLITLKGGDLKEEIEEVSHQHSVEKTPISKYYSDPYFLEKYILYVQG